MASVTGSYKNSKQTLVSAKRGHERERERSEQEFRGKAQQTYGRKEGGRELENKATGRVGWGKKKKGNTTAL